WPRSIGMITLACTHCKHNLKVKKELAGKKARCPRCGQPTPIPSGPAATAEPELPAEPEPTTSRLQSVAKDQATSLLPRPAENEMETLPPHPPTGGNTRTYQPAVGPDGQSGEGDKGIEHVSVPGYEVLG